MRARPDRGQAVLLMLVVVALCGLMAVAVGRLGGVLVDRQQAQTAADAAALAGVEGGRAAAADFAARNGGTLVAYDEVGSGSGVRTVTVTVSAGEATATARATNGP
jgi:Flp pilus assembly protein TadG